MANTEKNSKPEKNELSPKIAELNIKFKKLDKKEKEVVNEKDGNEVFKLARSTTDKISNNFLLPFSELLPDHSLNKNKKEVKEKEKDFREELKNMKKKLVENNNESNDNKDGKLFNK